MTELHFPLGGLNSAMAHRQQPPYTTPDCLNVRPYDAIERRQRGGSRPGLSKAYRQQLGTESNRPIRLLTDVTTVKDDGFRFWLDELEGVLGEQWETASWIGTPPPIFPWNVDNIDSPPLEAGSVRLAIADLDTTKAYSIEIFILPWDNENWGNYRLYARMNDTMPDVTQDGIEAELVLDGTDGTYSLSLKRYKDGDVVGTTTTAEVDYGDAEGGLFTLLINGNTVSCFWRGITLCEVDITGELGASAGNRVGFGMKVEDTQTEDWKITLVDYFMAQYYIDTIDRKYRKQLVASAAGIVYQEGLKGNIEEVTGLATSLAGDVELEAAEWNQKLFIADHGNPRVEGTSGTVSGTTFDDMDITNWTAHSIDKNGDVLLIYNEQGSTVGGTYLIESISAGSLTLASSPGDGTCDWRIERAPKVYDPINQTLTIWQTDLNDEETARKGIVPITCSMICRYWGCAVFAGDREDPHNYFISRVEDFYDFEYVGQDPQDPARAVNGELSEAGKVGEPITCLAPCNDDLLIFGGTDSLHVLRGHPLYSGTIDVLSNVAGVISKRAWCAGPQGEIYFLSNDGLWVMPSGAESVPTSLSYELMPKELQGINKLEYAVCLKYDREYRGVHIRVTPYEAQGNNKHWYYDLATASFWKDSFQSDHEAFVAHRYDTSPSVDSRVLFGCRDGWIRSFRDVNKRDDGYDIDSHVFIGPIPLGSNKLEKGIFREIWGTLGKNSDNVAWQLIVGESHEDVMARQEIRKSGTWIAGLNDSSPARVSGISFAIKFTSSGQWALEKIMADWMPVSRGR